MTDKNKALDDLLKAMQSHHEEVMKGNIRHEINPLCKQCWLNYWPEKLWKLHPQHETVITIRINDFIEALLEWGFDLKRTPMIDRLVALIDAKIDPNRRYFPRLNSRSPKDYMRKGKVLSCGEDIAEAIAFSMRCHDDLAEMRLAKEEARLYLFQYDYRMGENEFRVFVKDGDIHAITQYYPRSWTLNSEAVNAIYYAIKRFFPKIKDAFPVKDFVFDVIADPKSGKFAKAKGQTFADMINNIDIVFIEVNPFGYSDPVFFGSYDRMIANKHGFAYQTVTVDRFRTDLSIKYPTLPRNL